ncbi:hypothetical protein Aglo03_31630 [Actinokineospora globicatena]|uniref:Uncharacterized protein n=1 Tax=Actinokineospora globicatena TaxID=103729 RepID=A0A9W6QPL9_9PSEU|nr:hypothetical protein Aglo03_31630 [Actinokineospora globicatena]
MDTRRSPDQRRPHDVTPGTPTPQAGAANLTRETAAAHGPNPPPQALSATARSRATTRLASRSQPWLHRPNRDWPAGLTSRSYPAELPPATRPKSAPGPTDLTSR